MVQIAPSILAADFARLADEIARVEAAGADLLHVDVMDGHFVPNLTLGPPIVEAIRKVTKLPLDVHLMMTNPDAFIPEFAEAGVTLNPATSLTTIEEILPDVDLLLIMSVSPGFGGQPFISTSLGKIQRAR